MPAAFPVAGFFFSISTFQENPMPKLSPEQRAQLCQFTYSDGRRCRQPRTSTGNGFCYNHSRKERERLLLQELLDYLLEPLVHHTVSSTTLTFLLVRLYTAVAYGNIPPKLSNSLIRIVESLRRGLRDTEREFRNNFDPASLRTAIWNLYEEHADFVAGCKTEESQESSGPPNPPAPDAPDISTSLTDSPSRNPQPVPHAPIPLSPAEANAADFASSLSLKDIDALFKVVKSKTN